MSVVEHRICVCLCALEGSVTFSPLWCGVSSDVRVGFGGVVRVCVVFVQLMIDVLGT